MLGIDLRGHRAEWLVERKGWTDQGFRDVGGAMLVAGIDNLPLASSMARYRLTLARCQAPRGCGTNRQIQLRADAPGRCAEEKQRADDCNAAPAIFAYAEARAFCPSVALTVLDHWATAELTLARVRFSRFNQEFFPIYAERVPVDVSGRGHRRTDVTHRVNREDKIEVSGS